MQKLKLVTIKRELVALTHLNQVIDDFVNIMKSEVMVGIDPTYFTAVCRDLLLIIDDSPYVTDYFKQRVAKFIEKHVKKDGISSEQSRELLKLVHFIGDNISFLREQLLDNYD